MSPISPMAILAIKAFGLTLTLAFFISSSFAKNAFYQIVNGKPVLHSELTNDGQELSLEMSNPKTVPLKLRLKVKKFRIERTPGGPKISFEDVCEKNSTADVRDMTGGGLMQEEVFGTCSAEWMGKEVLVVLSGMVYDNIVSDFSDEERELKRNFFSHLSVEGTIGGFGLGDFNLDNTKTIQFGHWVSDLSVDPRYIPLDQTQYREGFTASIRYEL